MNVFSHTVSKALSGSVQLPSSKSYSIRAVIIAACGGMSLLKDVSECDDAQVALKTAQTIGCTVSRHGLRTYLIRPGSLPRRPARRFQVGESGTVLRFLLPLLPIYSTRATVQGKGTLNGRPNHLLLETLREQGIQIKGKGKVDAIPIEYRGGKLLGSRMEIDGSLSSQFVSALLIACPHLIGDSHVVIKGKRIVSADYIDMTLGILKKSGVIVRRLKERSYLIKGEQGFKGLKHFTVPSDYGLAAFLIAAGALHSSRLVLKGHFPADLPQADGRIIGLLQKMGVKLTTTTRSIRINGPAQLKGGDFSLKDCPDLVPIMAVTALFAKGKTRLRDIQHARVKESNRISDLRKELLKVGAKVSEKKNELIIEPQLAYRGGKTLDAHHDHRMAMAFAVLGTRIGLQVKGAQSVSKSYPAFFKDLRRIGGRISKA